MGGRISEEIIFESVTNGASDDIKRINEIAKNLVGVYGMGLNMINIDLDTKNNLFRKESERKIENFDKEVEKIIRNAYNETKQLINSNLCFLTKIQAKLLKNETIFLKDIENIYKSIS